MKATLVLASVHGEIDLERGARLLEPSFRSAQEGERGGSQGVSWRGVVALARRGCEGRGRRVTPSAWSRTGEKERREEGGRRGNSGADTRALKQCRAGGERRARGRGLGRLGRGGEKQLRAKNEVAARLAWKTFFNFSIT